MRNILFITILLLTFLITPAWGYSPLATDFLIAGRETEGTFPPEGWSNEDLRDGALEVLSTWTIDSEESTAIGFCLQTLGYVGYEEDIDIILAYEEELPRTVMRAMAEVTHPKSIECFLRWIDAEDIPEREIALMGLQRMNYDELAAADVLLNTAKVELLEMREVEQKERLVVLIDEILNLISVSEQDE